MDSCPEIPQRAPSCGLGTDAPGAGAIAKQYPGEKEPILRLASRLAFFRDRFVCQEKPHQKVRASQMELLESPLPLKMVSVPKN